MLCRSPGFQVTAIVWSLLNGARSISDSALAASACVLSERPSCCNAQPSESTGFLLVPDQERQVGVYPAIRHAQCSISHRTYEASLALEVGKVRSVTHDIPETVVATLMGRVVARLTKDGAIVYSCSSTKLDVFHMMSLGALAELVIPSARVPKAIYGCSATRTPVLLAEQRLLLRA